MTLEEIEKLCEQATPEPWSIFLEMGEHERVHLYGPKQFTQNRVFIEDAKFIAASRTIIPELVARVRELETITENSKRLLTSFIADYGNEPYIYINDAVNLKKAIEELEK